MVVPSCSIFVGHEYLKYGGCGWPDSDSLCYHIYLIALSYDLKDAVAFGYKASFYVVKKSATGSGKDGAEQNVDEASEINRDYKAEKREQEWLVHPREERFC